MDFIYFIQPARPEMPLSPTEEESALVGQHFNYLKTHFEDGRISFVGRTNTEPFVGLAVFSAEDETEAKAFTDNDPAIAAGIFNARVQPFLTFMARAKDLSG